MHHRGSCSCGAEGMHHGGMGSCCTCNPKQKMVMAMCLFIMLGIINFVIAGIIHLKAHMLE